MKYFLDTSVVMYAAGALHEYKVPCVAVLERIERKDIDAFTSTEVLQEIIYRYARLENKRNGIELARQLMRFVPVLPVDESIMESALDLFERYDIDPRDALHAATAIHFGIVSIVSVDRHFDRIEEIKRIDPTFFT